MGFLKRLFGGGGSQPGEPVAPPSGTRPVTPAPSGPAAPGGIGITADEGEATRDRELLRAESVRLQDDLLQRQMRYADRSWTPPAQGGTRRAEDEASADDR